jgi:hypothetical protein
MTSSSIAKKREIGRFGSFKNENNSLVTPLNFPGDTYESHIGGDVIMITSHHDVIVEYDNYMSIRPNSRRLVQTHINAIKASLTHTFKSWNRFEVFGSFLFRKSTSIRGARVRRSF